MRLLVYCQDVTEQDLMSLNTFLVIPPYYYFIVINKNYQQINLFTYENRQDLTICHESQQLIQINQFSSTELNWKHKPIFPKKYRNFHGCLMKLGVSDRTNLFKHFRHDSKIELTGMIYDLVVDISSVLNFTAHFGLCYESNCLDYLKKSTLYNMIFVGSLDGHAYVSGGKFGTNQVMLNIQCR